MDLFNQFRQPQNNNNVNQLNELIKLIGNRNPKDVFMEECKKRGLNPDDILKLLNKK